MILLGNEGIEDAQEYVAEALFFGKLSQDQKNDTQRFIELKQYAEANWKKARYYVFQAIYKRYLSCKNLLIKEQYIELSRLHAMGWFNDDSSLKTFFIEFIKEHGSRGVILKSSDVSFLERLAQEGYYYAQQCVVEKCYEDALLNQSRAIKNKLQKCVERRYVGAQEAAHKVERVLLARKVSEEERYQVFKILSEKTTDEIDIILKTGEFDAANPINPIILKYLRKINITKEAAQDELVELLSERVDQDIVKIDLRDIHNILFSIAMQGFIGSKHGYKDSHKAISSHWIYKQ